MSVKVELHVVVDRTGVRSVQIIGPPEVHPEGHDMYFRLRPLIPELDREIRRLLQNNETNGGKEEH